MKIPDPLKSLFGLPKQEEAPAHVPSDDSNKKPVEMLRELPWLSIVDDKVFQKVLDGFEHRQFQEGATLLKEKDPENGMFVIAEGL